MADLNDDIDKYLKGELTPAEMHALEKRALGDPFLGEALEGAGQITPEHLAADLKSLQSALAERVKTKAGKVIPFWVWPARIAAGLLLIALSTIVILNLTKNERSQDLAAKEEAPESTTEEYKKNEEPVATDSVVSESKDLLTLAKPEEPKSKATAPIPADQQNKGEVASETQPAAAEKPQPSEVPKSDEVHTAAEIIVEEKIAQAVQPETQSQAALKKSEARRFATRELESEGKAAAGAPAERSALDAPSNSRVIRGQVRAEDGSGLPGVNVMIQGTIIGTVTDASGNYQIAVPQQNANLVFSFIGFMSTALDVGQEDQLDVLMSEDVSQLSEVVVVGYGTDRDTDDQLTNLELANPAGGRKAFKQYLEKNMHYPEQALEQKVEGKVTVQFTVESSGQLSDFSVIKGIGNGCDEEVIRLIKQGPRWTPTKRNNDSLRDKVKVRMKFELPKK